MTLRGRAQRRLERKRVNWLPSAEERLLLDAALMDGNVAREAWGRWRTQVALDDVDASSQQLLPLLCRNLSRLEVEDPDLGRLRGVYRYSWSRNQLLLRLGEQVIRALEDAGIETLVLKGAALGALHYRDPGARPMHDVDVLVRRERALDAITVLQSFLGRDPSMPSAEGRVSVRHSTPFEDAHGHEVDLHWYSLWQSAPDGDFWDACVPLEIAGAQTRALSAPDQLLHTCIHGADWSPGSRLRWIADAIVVLRSAGADFDWGRLAFQARARMLAPNVREALSYLQSDFGVAIPEETLDALADARDGFLDHAARVAAMGRTTPSGFVLMHWDRQRRMKRLDPAAPRQRHLLAQMRAGSGNDSYLGFSRFALNGLISSRR